MPYASETFTGVATVATYAFGAGTGSLTGGLKFLSSEHLTVLVDGSPATFTIPAGHASFTITGLPILGGEEIVVSRATPATEAGRLVNFEDLSHVRQSDLDRSSLQLFYILQEGLDVVTGAECLEASGGVWQGEARRIESLLPGVAGTDAATKSQLDAAVIASGNLPVVTAADNDKSLWVVGGVWTIRTPAQARVHLGLGTAASFDAGTLAGNVVQLDGSARYPANDGRLIDLTNNAVTTTLNLRYRSTVGLVVQASEQTPNTDAAATWSEGASSRITPGTLTALDNSSDVTVDNGAKKVTLSAGTWEIEYSVRAYNGNASSTDIQQLKVRLTDDVDGPTQVVYDDAYSAMGIESGGTGVRKTWSLTGTILLKLAAGGVVVFRASQNTSSDIRLSSLRAAYRKVSTAT